MASPGSAAEAGPKPEAFCLQDATGNFAYRLRPAHCDFYDARAPGSRINRSAIFMTKGVSWSHWGRKSAIGRGKYREPAGWLQVRLRMARPKMACGQLVFTRMRMNLQTCSGRWTGWRSPIAVEACTDSPSGAPGV